MWNFIRSLNLQTFTDQPAVAFAIWLLFIYLALTEPFDWQFRLVLIIGGGLLNLVAIYRAYKRRSISKTLPTALMDKKPGAMVALKKTKY